MELTEDQVTQICIEYAKGGGLRGVLQVLGYPVRETMLELQKNHYQRITEAKPK